MTEPTGGIDAFERLSLDDMVRWLAVAVREYFEESRGAAAFAPFLLNLDRAESEAQALARCIALLPARVAEPFAVALSIYVQRVNADQSSIWRFVTELILRLDAAEAIKTLERKWNEHFLGRMEVGSPGIVDDMLVVVRNVSPAHERSVKPLAALLHRLILSGAIPNARASVTLIRLCEVDPDDWALHVGRLREILFRQLCRIRETKGWEAMISAQDKLAIRMLGLIGLERFAAGLEHLLFGRDAPSSLATDNWLWRALVERTKLVEPYEGGWLALANQPSARVRVRPVALNLAAAAFDEVRSLGFDGNGTERSALDGALHGRLVGDESEDMEKRDYARERDEVLGTRTSPVAEIADA